MKVALISERLTRRCFPLKDARLVAGEHAMEVPVWLLRYMISIATGAITASTEFMHQMHRPFVIGESAEPYAYVVGHFEPEASVPLYVEFLFEKEFVEKYEAVEDGLVNLIHAMIPTRPFKGPFYRLYEDTDTDERHATSAIALAVGNVEIVRFPMQTRPSQEEDILAFLNSCHEKSIRDRAESCNSPTGTWQLTMYAHLPLTPRESGTFYCIGLSDNLFGKTKPLAAHTAAVLLPWMKQVLDTYSPLPAPNR